MVFKREGNEISLEEFQKWTGARWIHHLEFEEPTSRLEIRKRGERLYQKGEMSREQLWLGRYFQKELESAYSPDVEIRWIDPILGWGVFALRNFKKMEFIAQYTGSVRKRRRADRQNAYCFEYLIAQGISSPYTIDALEQGGISRYINHSFQPNLNSSLATLDFLSHIIFYTKEPIARGEQLCYDYGPDYWAKRTPPLSL